MFMGKYIMALDQGTTSSRTILFDHSGKVICQANKVFQNFPCNSLHLHAFSLLLFYARKNYKERPGAKHLSRTIKIQTT